MILTNALEDGSTAMDFMCDVPEGSGLEVWRKSARHNLPRAVGHDRARMTQLLAPPADLLKLDYWSKVEKWEEMVKEYERTNEDKEKVPDKMKAGVPATVLSPRGLL